MVYDKELKSLFYIGDSGIHGKGLYAKVSIDEGDYLGTYVGPEAQVNGCYVLWIEQDGGKWGGARWHEYVTLS